jgi:hypothetical protein
MRVLVIKYRKEFRKVILSKFTSMRKKNMKICKICTVPGSPHRGFSINIKVYTYVVTVQWLSLLLYRFLLQSAHFILKSKVFFFPLTHTSQGPSPPVVQYSLTASSLRSGLRLLTVPLQQHSRGPIGSSSCLLG